MYYNFSRKDSSSNMISMKCAYTLFTKDGILNNIANYILLLFILLFLISSIAFYKCGYPLLEDDINEIIELKKEDKENRENKNIIETNCIKIKTNKIKKAKNKRRKKKKFTNPKKENEISLNKSNNISSFNKIKLVNKGDSVINQKNSKKKFTKPNNLKTRVKFNDFEINVMSYKNAIKHDKRTFCAYYNALIKAKHPIIFSFCPFKDYNSFIIKIDLFALSFSLNYFFNALFFDEAVIHKIYEDEGDL